MLQMTFPFLAIIHKLHTGDVAAVKIILCTSCGPGRRPLTLGIGYLPVLWRFAFIATSPRPEPFALWFAKCVLPASSPLTLCACQDSRWQPGSRRMFRRPVVAFLASSRLQNSLHFEYDRVSLTWFANLDKIGYEHVRLCRHCIPSPSTSIRSSSSLSRCVRLLPRTHATSNPSSIFGFVQGSCTAANRNRAISTMGWVVSSDPC